jgi:hypothetical protein
MLNYVQVRVPLFQTDTTHSAVLLSSIYIPFINPFLSIFVLILSFIHCSILPFFLPFINTSVRSGLVQNNLHCNLRTNFC